MLEFDPCTLLGYCDASCDSIISSVENHLRPNACKWQLCSTVEETANDDDAEYKDAGRTTDCSELH